jgi:hypothetical protein
LFSYWNVYRGKRVGVLSGHLFRIAAVDRLEKIIGKEYPDIKRVFFAFAALTRQQYKDMQANGG